MDTHSHFSCSPPQIKHFQGFSQPRPFVPPPLYYLTSCDYETPDKGLCLFTLSKVHKRPPPHFTVNMIGLLRRCTGDALRLVFLKVEATDLNKCPSIMNTALKLQKLAGSCLIKLRVLLSGVGGGRVGGRMTGNGNLF